MQKLIKVGNKIIVFLDNNTSIEREVDNDTISKVINAASDEEIIKILNPNYYNILDEYNKATALITQVSNSKILSIEDDTIYWKSVSKLSVPKELAEAVLNAENQQDKLKLLTYKNFWTLMSLNLNEECRRNLFWFLQKYGMTISRSGFFVAYRNVDSTSKKGIYTDHYSHSYSIKVGEMVTMNRSECDCDSSISCSRGLHCAGKGWLKANYYGDTGLACLVNPADVTAVPKIDNYGKLRTCAYLPMKIIKYDENDDVIPLDVEDGFDCSYVTKVIYEGTMGTEKDSTYKINIPEISGTTVESIQDKLLDIANECIINRKL